MIRKIAVYWLPPIALMIAIFLMSSRESIAVTEEFVKDFIIFKSLHVAEYALLTFLLFRALINTTSLRLKDVLIISTLLAFLYGFTDEIHQTFVPTRQGSVRDVLIDGIGIFGMIHFIRERTKKSVY